MIVCSLQVLSHGMIFKLNSKMLDFNENSIKDLFHVSIKLNKLRSIKVDVIVFLYMLTQK